jgi:hypothetical protein
MFAIDKSSHSRDSCRALMKVSSRKPKVVTRTLNEIEIWIGEASGFLGNDADPLVYVVAGEIERGTRKR